MLKRTTNIFTSRDLLFILRDDRSTPGIPNGTRSLLVLRFVGNKMTAMTPTDIFHNARRTEKKNIEARVEFLPRPCWQG
jgi:hypothetical protein